MSAETRLFRLPLITAAGPLGPQREPAHVRTPGVVSWGQAQDHGDGTATVYVTGTAEALDAIEAQDGVVRL